MSNKNFYTKGQAFHSEEIKRGIISFMKEKGGEVSHQDISDFIFNKWGIRFGEIHYVMWNLRKEDSRVVRGQQRGYSKLIEAEGGEAK